MREWRHGDAALLPACHAPGILLPDADGPELVLNGVLGTLTRLPFVRRVALFGSLAERRGDRWSDVDLWVDCAGVDETQWVAAAAIRAAHPVLFYRMFGSLPQPTGRYWFADESPFHTVDVSFHSHAAYVAQLAQPTLCGYPVVAREIFVRTAEAIPVTLPEPCSPLEISEHERQIGACIYLLLRAVKLYCRGEWERLVLEERYDTLVTILGGIGRAAVMAGGAIGELAFRMLVLAARWLMGTEPCCCADPEKRSETS